MCRCNELKLLHAGLRIKHETTKPVFLSLTSNSLTAEANRKCVGWADREP